MPRTQHHRTPRSGWLRAAVLGADDGLISTASLLLGVASAAASRGEVLIAGVAGLVAGAMAMAAGEYVSVSSQADMEQADLALERAGLAANAEAEHEELASLYVERGLDRDLAAQVARQLMAHDALGTHAREELGLSEQLRARPLQAAAASAASFAVGAAIPLAIAVVVPSSAVALAVVGGSLLSLAALGASAARAGGAEMARGSLRVLFWGALAMGVTAGVGRLFRGAL
jgi:vacuolar iron transporter family protein